MKFLKAFGLLAAALLVMTQALADYTATPADWLCTGKVGGASVTGRIASGCDVDAFGPPSFVRGNYGGNIFNDAAYDTTNSNAAISVLERNRYMQEMYPVVRDAAQRYLLSRKPDVNGTPGFTADELTAFQRGVFSLLRQESIWSHYRDAQTGTGQPFVLKMLRGDSGHGHGMMQVDDRYHQAQLLNGKGWNMLQNFTYGMDIYFDGWQKAANPVRTSTGGCLAGRDPATDTNYWRDRARSAWSAYNGGPTKICRWMNDAVPADPNATSKDPQYLAKWDAQAWNAEVANKARAAAIDLPCLMDNGSQCPLPVGGVPTAGTLLKLGASACVITGGQIECVDDVRDAACLGSRASFDDSQITTIYASSVYGLTRVDHNRHQLCRAGVAGLQALGTAIATTTPLELRSAVGGMVLGSLLPGNFQVLDFEVRGQVSQERYYRVRGAVQGGQTLDGWIFAGDRNSYATVSSNAAPLAAGALAYPGDWVQVNVTTSLNLRASPPSGTVLTTMPRGAVVQVKEVFGTASANNLYYRTEYLGKDGWFFAGNLYPTSSLASWAIPAATPATPTKHAHCPAGTRYDIQSRYCLSATSAYGPFTAAATDQCVGNGAGAVCTALRGTAVDGTVMQVQIWNKATTLAAVGNGDCPRGAVRSIAHRFHCTESVVRNDVSETDVYGPFGTTLVNACLAANANAAFCKSNRWPGTAFLALQP